MYHNIHHVTLLYWNFRITVAILRSLGQELDPMLDLGHTAVNSVAGALTPETNHPHLGKSKYIKLFINCNTIFYLILFIYGY